MHELCHAAIGTDAGHGPRFRAIAVELGLVGKMTATQPGPELTERLNALCRQIGEYPHATLDIAAAVKKQGTRMLKLECPECGYTVRTTRQWIAVGLPTCPCGEEMAMPEGEEG